MQGDSSLIDLQRENGELNDVDLLQILLGKH